MCTVVLPPRDNPIAVNKCIIYHISYHIISFIRLRWLEDVQKDLREMVRWRQKTVEREEWASVINEVKSVSGP